MIRLVLWTVLMAYIGFLLAGRFQLAPLGVTLTGALMGAGSGSIVGIMFASRSIRKQSANQRPSRS